MTALVLDASAAVARALDEAGSATVSDLLNRHEGPLLVPSAFWLEVINVLVRRHRLSGAEVLEAIREIEELAVETVDLSAADRLVVLDLVERHGLSAYDASYLALAEAADARLLTLDRALAAAAGRRAIFIGTDGRIAETPPAYAAEPTWPSWRGAAAYLAELRRRAVLAD